MLVVKKEKKSRVPYVQSIAKAYNFKLFLRQFLIRKD